MGRLLALLLSLSLLPSAVALADARLDCIARCETPTADCMNAASKTRDTCVVSARQTCRTRPPSEQFTCLSTTGRTCASARAAQASACRATFDACYAACGARPAGTSDYWCSLDYDGQGSRVYREWFCAGTPSGENPRRRCMALLKDAPEAGYSLACDPLR